MDLSEQFNSSVNRAFSVIESNKVLSTILGLFLVLYAALAAPILPMSVTKIFRNTWFKLAFMFLIAYVSTKDPSVAIISAVALLVTLQTLSAQETTNAVIKAVEKKVDSNIEAFADVEPSLSTDNYGELSDYSAPYQNYEILSKEAVVPSESDRQRQLESTQYVLNNQVDMNTYVTQPVTETQMIPSTETVVETEQQQQDQDQDEDLITSTIKNVQSLINNFENVDGIVQPYGGEINYEINSGNNGMETFVNDNEEQSEPMEQTEKTQFITGTCGSAIAATDMPGYEDGEFASFN